MRDWHQLNERIASCRKSADPQKCLEALYESTRDGHVAMALGNLHRSRGETGDAHRWFRQAEQRYPLERFKAQARAAAESVASKAIAKSEPNGQPTSVLHVISCSRSKAWHNGKVTEQYVPASQAYRGSEMSEWLLTKESRTVRWLVLSAKYGFIEPEHPIGDYDVTFGDVSTGPIPFDALREQVRGQVRWADKVRLNSFSDVVVHGGNDYVAACRAAFQGVARVRKAGSRGPEDLPVANPAPKAPHGSRATALAATFRQIPDAVYAALDRREPEWPILERLADGPSHGLVITLALALTDYQLGQGGAHAYWQAIGHLLDEFGVPTNSNDVLAFIRRLVATPVSSRLASAKTDRIQRLLDSGLPEEIALANFESIGRHSDRLWNRLASAMRQAPEDKTIAFAMKVFDLLHCVVTERYTVAGEQAPIIADLRVARVTFSAGLLEPPPGVAVRDAMVRAEEILKNGRATFLRAWEGVRVHGGLNMFRLDSLVWQFSEPIYRHRNSVREAREHVADGLCNAGLVRTKAEAVATEMTNALS